jgi:hypothetical protein
VQTNISGVKTVISSENITPFAGFNFVFKTLKDSGLFDLIDRYQEVWGKGLGFSISEILPTTRLFFSTEVI